MNKQQLAAKIWESANRMRSKIEANEYKDYILGFIFYKYLSDKEEQWLLARGYDADSIKEYVNEDADDQYSSKSSAQQSLGYFIAWKDLFSTWIHMGADFSIDNVRTALSSFNRLISESHRRVFEGIFNTLETGLSKLGENTKSQTKAAGDLIELINEIPMTGRQDYDVLGFIYEYLIKKFADDSGHTAQEFYTNRTVVHLMTEMLKPQPGESVYDPTCGSAGMLISCIAYLKEHDLEWRNLRVYGQEINQLTSAIGRMNLFLHGVETFEIVNDDTLTRPAFIENGKLKTFNIVLANPPYSIKQWDRSAFETDRYGRNFLGVPPQGRADYAFFQHILKSLDKDTGRCAILFPHGVLFRDEEREMRERLVTRDLIECIIGLGPNLFFNSPMEACIVICRAKKEVGRQGKILFINAVKEVTRINAQSYLEETHINHIAHTYLEFISEDKYSVVAPLQEVKDNNYSLNIPLYVRDGLVIEDTQTLRECVDDWEVRRLEVADSLTALSDMII